MRFLVPECGIATAEGELAPCPLDGHLPMVIAKEEFPVGDGKVGEGIMLPIVVKGETDLATIVGKSPAIFVVLAKIHSYSVIFWLHYLICKSRAKQGARLNAKGGALLM